jgi:hypothetical protein
MRSPSGPSEPDDDPDNGFATEPKEIAMSNPSLPLGTPTAVEAGTPGCCEGCCGDCCGGPALTDASACCALDEAQKAAGNAGCGCRPAAAAAEPSEAAGTGVDGAAPAAAQPPGALSHR